jgi:hypothetical protein
LLCWQALSFLSELTLLFAIWFSLTKLKYFIGSSKKKTKLFQFIEVQKMRCMTGKVQVGRTTLILKISDIRMRPRKSTRVKIKEILGNIEGKERKGKNP